MTKLTLELPESAAKKLSALLGYRTLATDLLNEAHIPAIEPDITILADDLTKVHYEPRIDGKYAGYKADWSVSELLLSRIGGIGALSRYMLCIRKGKR